MKFKKRVALIFVLLIIFVLKFNIYEPRKETKSFCVSYPEERDIFVDNLMWQVLETSGGFLYLLRAYLDLRWQKSVIITAIGTKYILQPDTLFCQYWFEDKQPIVKKVRMVHNMWRLQNDSNSMNRSEAPFLIYCPYDFNEKKPISLSLTTEKCENAQNLMTIIDNQPPDGIKKKFVVCTKPLELKKGSMDPTQFIEWTESLKILGAEKIFIYHRYLDPKIFKIAKYYEQKGFMILEQYLEPSGVSRARTHCYESQINEYPIFNDCFYRVRNLYEYVVIVDHDEVLIPIRDSERTWEDLIKALGKHKKFDSYAFRSVTYPPYLKNYIKEIPSHFYMLQHVQRAKKYLKGPKLKRFKSIIKPDRISVIFTHGAEYCFNKECNTHYVSKKYGQCSHYRDSLKEPSDNNTKLDMTFWKYKDELMEAVEKTLNELNYVYRKGN